MTIIVSLGEILLYELKLCLDCCSRSKNNPIGQRVSGALRSVHARHCRISLVALSGTQHKPRTAVEETMKHYHGSKLNRGQVLDVKSV